MKQESEDKRPIKCAKTRLLNCLATLNPPYSVICAHTYAEGEKERDRE